MADYNKLTVALLREEMKARGIPATGLTRKAQLIERLQQDDAQTRAQAGAEVAQEDREGGSEAQAQTQGEGQESNDVELKAQAKAQVDAPVTGDDMKAVAGNIIASDTSAGVRGEEKVEENVNKEAKPHSKQDAAQEAGQDRTQGMKQEVVAPREEKPSAGIDSESNVKEQRETPKPAAVSREAPQDLARSEEPSVPQPTASANLPDLSPGTADSKKRKRRSMTPPLSETELAKKKARQEDHGGEVHLKEDEAVSKTADITANANGDEMAVDADAFKKFEQETKQKPADAETIQANESMQALPEPVDVAMADANTDVGNQQRTRPTTASDNKYRDLFNARPEAPVPIPAKDEDDDRTVSPSIHPATSALYIREMMRPLHPRTLKDYLQATARPRNQTEHVEDDTKLLEFHLDAIRTHCFAVFPSIAAAARVRTALHDRVWPVERDRKALWVDFVPAEQVSQWIARELRSGAGGRGAGPVRWEVVYDTDEAGIVTATHQEAGPGTVRRPSAPTQRDIGQESSSRVNETTGPVRRRELPGAPTRPVGSASFQALDARFRSTTAKPKLYFLPVTRELAEKRLAELQRLSSRRRGSEHGPGGEKRRYTFEEGDLLVDNGPEYGLRRERGPGGGGGGRPQGRYR